MKSVLLAVLLLWSGSVLSQADDDMGSAIEKVSIADVPAIVMEAARKEKPDAFFKYAERTFWNDEPTYVVTGAEFKKEWKIYVGSQGQVKHISSDFMDSD
jgi:hypothetical protein